jgi:RNA polymerase sigma-70 factor (ECF subfamily)
VRAEAEITESYLRHADMVWRVCLAYLKNPADAEDALQDTFLRLLRREGAFRGGEHEKAWLIRTAGHVCKDVLKHPRRRQDSLDAHGELSGGPEPSRAAEGGALFQAVCALPDKYKTVVCLYYYEGCTSPEIAGLLRKPQGTVLSLLYSARRRLKEILGSDFYET